MSTDTEPLEPDYTQVETWEDLLDTNALFLHGEVHQTFYYGAPLEAESSELLDDLQELHKLGVFTHQSQPNRLRRQRSYVQFAHPDNRRGWDLMLRLQADERVYVSLQTKGRAWDNFPARHYGLTCGYWVDGPMFEYTNWRAPEFGEEPYICKIAREYANSRIADMLREALLVKVVLRAPNYDAEVEATTIVLEHLKKL